VVASVGGRVNQLYRYFPKLCHPTCGMEINLKLMRAQSNLTLLTMDASKIKPLVYYSTLMSVVYGGSYNEGGLDGQLIRAKKLEEIAAK